MSTGLERDEAVNPVAEAPLDQLLRAVVDAEGNGLRVRSVAVEPEPFSAAEHVRCTRKNHFGVETVSLLCTYKNKCNQVLKKSKEGRTIP